VIYGRGCLQTEGNVQYSPNKFCKVTIYEKVLYCFIIATETTCCGPCQFLLSKLSLVNITFLYNSQRITLTFSGILSFHRNILCGTISESIIAIYIELTENCPLDVSAHLKMPGYHLNVYLQC
jgi:hypothetical protein